VGNCPTGADNVPVTSTGTKVPGKYLGARVAVIYDGVTRAGDHA